MAPPWDNGPPDHRTFVTPSAKRGTRPGAHGDCVGSAIASATSTRGAVRSSAPPPEGRGVPSTSLWEDELALFDVWRNHGTRMFAICARVSRRPIWIGRRQPGLGGGGVEGELGVVGLRLPADDGVGSLYACLAATGWFPERRRIKIHASLSRSTQISYMSLGKIRTVAFSHSPAHVLDAAATRTSNSSGFFPKSLRPRDEEFMSMSSVAGSPSAAASQPHDRSLTPDTCHARMRRLFKLT